MLLSVFALLSHFRKPYLAQQITKNTHTFAINKMESLSRANEILEKGSYDYTIGVDEAGRGPLAGPVVAAACLILGDIDLAGIVDSKKTKEIDRDVTYTQLIENPNVVWGVSVVSREEIDTVNILQATMNGMTRAVQDLLAKMKKNIENDCIALIDGNRVPKDMPIAGKYVIKGDSKIYSIAAASVIAKVTRDNIMKILDGEYPQYRLAKHKGYPTQEHVNLLMEFGPSDIHRQSYSPVKLAMAKHGGITVLKNSHLNKAVSAVSSKLRVKKAAAASDDKKRKLGGVSSDDSMIVKKKNNLKSSKNSSVINLEADIGVASRTRSKAK